MGKVPGLGIRALVRRWVRWWRTGGEYEGEEDGDGDGEPEESLFEDQEYTPEMIGGRTDIRMELGVEPAEFVQRILEVEGGRMRQRDFDEYGDFSPSTICRMLQELEEEGVVERYRVGREKIVTLPGEEGRLTNDSDSGTTLGVRESANTD